MKKILISLATLSLVACGSFGSGGASDTQNASASIGSSSNKFTITQSTVEGCKGITTNGKCSVNIVYTGTGSYAGQLSLNTLDGYTSTVAKCDNASGSSQSCTFTINNTGGSFNTPQTVTIYSNGQPLGLGLFVIGGGV